MNIVIVHWLYVTETQTVYPLVLVCVHRPRSPANCLIMWQRI